MAVALIAVVWTAITLYAVFGGADFGAGILHLIVRGPNAVRQRRTIVQAMGPVWEANHVWLIFAITGLFTAFPRALQALGTLVFAPATLALIAIATRGAAFAFAAGADGEPGAQAMFTRLFGATSLAAPFLLGTVAGGLARARGGPTGFAIGPFELAIGTLAVAICAALAATFLTVECRRAGDERLATSFRALALRRPRRSARWRWRRSVWPMGKLRACSIVCLTMRFRRSYSPLPRWPQPTWRCGDGITRSPAPRSASPWSRSSGAGGWPSIRGSSAPAPRSPAPRRRDPS